MNALRLIVSALCLCILSESVRAQGPDDWQSLLRQAEALEKAGREREAIALYLKAVPPVEAQFGATSKVAADVYNLLGAALARQAEYEAAGEWFAKALKGYETVYGANHLDVAGMLNNLAILKRRTGRYDDSEKLFLRSLALYEPRLGSNHPEVAETLDNLATLYRDMGLYSDADRVYHRALRIFESRGLEAKVADLKGELGMLYQYQGRRKEAEAMLKTAVQSAQARLGPDHPEVGVLLGNLAGAYQAQERYAEAEPLLLRSLAIFESKYGADHPNVGVVLNNLASLRSDQKKFAEAEEIYARAIKIKKEKNGVDHPAYANAIDNLAVCYFRQGKLDDSEKNAREALRIREAAFGVHHPNVATIYERLALIEAQRGGDVSAVLRHFEQARKGMRHHIAHVLPNLNDRQQLEFLRSDDQRGFHEALWFSATTGKPEAAASGAEWLLNGKGVGHIASAQRALLLRAGRERNAEQTVNQLLDVRRKLADLSMTAAEPSQPEARRATLARLTAQDAELSKQLAVAVGTGDDTSKWITTAEVRRALSADGVLIDLAKVDVTDFKITVQPEQRPVRYLAWITPPAGNGDVRVVDLGPADEIDALVVTVRGHLETAGSPNGKLATEGEAAAVAALAPEMKMLAAKVWRPLTPHLAAAKQLLLSPDGMLWLIPWAALPTGDDKHLIEDYSLRFLISGRDSIPGDAKPISTTPPVIFADPEFDASGAAKRAKLQVSFPKDPIAPAGTRGFAAQSVLPKVAALPGTATEAELIQPRLEKYAGGRAPALYARDNAFEYMVKKIVRPQVYVFATHGFFLPDQEKPPGDSEIGVDATGVELENPLLRCGLLLMGCNDRSGGTAEDDGILTGLEICGLDLRGTRLVVLSACETGIGKVHNGEGVAGLRQAFQLAGAEAVVASLWQVPDKDSALLMTEFFTQLADGKSKAEAMRQAQLARIASRTERFGAAHPFYWAAWTLTGN